MPNQLTRFVLESPPKYPALPLVHTTEAYYFRDVIERGELEPSICKVFKGEKLLYLYYGRPAYRVGREINPNTLNAFFPVCFLLVPECIKTAKRVFPFDSGAFDANLFSEYLHGEMGFKNFIIDPHPSSPGKIPIPETPARIISAFFGENDMYYSGVVKNSLDLAPFQFEAQSLHEIMRAIGKKNFDDRCSSIEIQIETPIALSTDTLIAVILPTVFMEQRDAVERISEWKAKVLTYGTCRSTPSHYTVLILDIARKFLLDEGYL